MDAGAYWAAHMQGGYGIYAGNQYGYYGAMHGPEAGLSFRYPVVGMPGPDHQFNQQQRNESDSHITDSENGASSKPLKNLACCFCQVWNTIWVYLYPAHGCTRLSSGQIGAYGLAEYIAASLGT